MRNERMCLSKKVFWSGVIANTRAAQINRRGVRGGGTMRAYQCPNCSQWHLTSQGQR